MYLERIHRKDAKSSSITKFQEKETQVNHKTGENKTGRLQKA
jgi:hypothetical protein